MRWPSSWSAAEWRLLVRAILTRRRPRLRHAVASLSLRRRQLSPKSISHLRDDTFRHPCKPPHVVEP